MNFNQNVDKEVVDAILESSLWGKAKINVTPRVDESSENEGEIGNIAEYENDRVANQYAEPNDIEEREDGSEDVSFTLDDLQFVLDNLEDEDLMEHAMNMLDVFDVAYEELNEGLDSNDEDEDEEEEEEEEEALEERYGAMKDDESKTHKGEEDYTTKKGMRKKTGRHGRAFKK